uniref:Candidate secreted effector n=1 Tax=Meloidogyne incognita TaxID=6306 RepID=A0A914MEV5_MELIC
MFDSPSESKSSIFEDSIWKQNPVDEENDFEDLEHNSFEDTTTTTETYNTTPNFEDNDNNTLINTRNKTKDSNRQNNRKFFLQDNDRKCFCL